MMGKNFCGELVRGIKLSIGWGFYPVISPRVP
jgi:hypothetical protein